MKQLFTLSVGAIMAASLFTACSKGGGYTPVDHTTGMTRIRSWSGTAAGFYQGDTVILGATKTWALTYNHVISDTSLAVQKINGFLLSFMGKTMKYISTDSITTQSVYFDSITTGTLTAKLYYYYAHDSLTFQLNQVNGFNTNANQYYQDNVVLHTNPN